MTTLFLAYLWDRFGYGLDVESFEEWLFERWVDDGKPEWWHGVPVTWLAARAWRAVYL